MRGVNSVRVKRFATASRHDHLIWSHSYITILFMYVHYNSSVLGFFRRGEGEISIDIFSIHVFDINIGTYVVWCTNFGPRKGEDITP